MMIISMMMIVIFTNKALKSWTIYDDHSDYDDRGDDDIDVL